MGCSHNSQAQLHSDPRMPQVCAPNTTAATGDAFRTSTMRSERPASSPSRLSIERHPAQSVWRSPSTYSCRHVSHFQSRSILQCPRRHGANTRRRGGSTEGAPTSEYRRSPRDRLSTGTPQLTHAQSPRAPDLRIVLRSSTPDRPPDLSQRQEVGRPQSPNPRPDQHPQQPSESDNRHQPQPSPRTLGNQGMDETGGSCVLVLVQHATAIAGRISCGGSAGVQLATVGARVAFRGLRPVFVAA